MIQRVLYMFIVACFISCGSKAVITPVEQAKLETAIATQEFEISLDWAYALNTETGQLLNSLNPAGTVANGNRFYIQNGNHTFKIAQDSVQANLPYFGTRQISGGLPGNQGITIDQALTKWEVKDPEKEGAQNIDLRAKENGEVYEISVTLYAKGNASVFVSSSQREGIRYTGTWE